MFGDETETKTMWSESLFDSLYTALRRGGKEEAIRGVVKDLKAKGYGNVVLVSKVQQKLGAEQANRLRGILGMPVAKGRAGAGARAGARKGGRKSSQSASGLQSMLRMLGDLWEKLTRVK